MNHLSDSVFVRPKEYPESGRLATLYWNNTHFSDTDDALCYLFIFSYV